MGDTVRLLLDFAADLGRSELIPFERRRSAGSLPRLSISEKGKPAKTTRCASSCGLSFVSSTLQIGGILSFFLPVCALLDPSETGEHARLFCFRFEGQPGEHRRHSGGSSLSVRRGFRRWFSTKRSTTARGHRAAVALVAAKKRSPTRTSVKPRA
jgi:hypothetical protein